MENQQQENTKAKSITDNPKPTDDAQLAIETVTPDTHQPLPETPVDNKKVEEILGDVNDNEQPKAGQDLNGQSAIKEDNETNEKDLIDDAGDNDNVVQEQEDENSKDKGEDERDKIETVAP